MLYCFKMYIVGLLQLYMYSKSKLGLFKINKIDLKPTTSDRDLSSNLKIGGLDFW